MNTTHIVLLDKYASKGSSWLLSPNSNFPILYGDESLLNVHNVGKTLSEHDFNISLCPFHKLATDEYNQGDIIVFPPWLASGRKDFSEDDYNKFANVLTKKCHIIALHRFSYYLCEEFLDYRYYPNKCSMITRKLDGCHVLTNHPVLTKDVNQLIGINDLQSKKDYFTIISENNRKFTTLIEKHADKEKSFNFTLFGYQQLSPKTFAFLVNIGHVELVQARAHLLSKLIHNIANYIKSK